MGLLSDDYYKKLQAQPAAQPVQPPSAPPPTAPVTSPISAPSSEGPIADLENRIINPIDAREQQNIQNVQAGFSTKGDRPIDTLSEAEQIAKFGGPVGSQAYFDYQAKHPYQSFLGRAAGEAFGVKFPDQQTWDKITFAEKARYNIEGFGNAVGRMIVRAPRETVKAPVRALYSIAKPWAELVKTGKLPTFDSSRNDEINVPWLGKVPTYWKDYQTARDSGAGPLAAGLATGSLALGDVTMSASLAEAATKAFQPRAVVEGKPQINVKPVQQALVNENGVSKVVQKAAGSPAEYYPLPKTVAKKYGGNSGNTFLKVSPATAGGDVEVAVVQTRGGMLQRAEDFFRGRKQSLYQGDFGPETKFDRTIVPKNKSAVVPGETSISPTPEITDEAAQQAFGSVMSKPLKGFENKPVTDLQVQHLSDLAGANRLNSDMADAVIRTVTGKQNISELTQAEYVRASQALSAVNSAAKFAGAGDPVVNPLSQYISPQRHWMRSYEERSGIPLYSDVYVPMEDAMRVRNTFRDTYRNKAREIFGDYAGPNFGEERRLVKAYMEGDKAAIEANDALTPQVKQDLARIATELRPLYDDLGQTFGIPTDVFLKDYQPHIQDLGGIYQLYKEGTDTPSALSFFAEKKRKGSLSVQVDDALALFDIYADAGSNKMFLNPALERAARLKETLPATLKNSVESYVGEKLGYAGRLEQYVNEAGIRLGEKLGWNLPPDIGRQAVKVLMDTTYSGALGLRPAAVVRNLFQYHLMTYPRLGSEFAIDAMKKALSKEGIAEMKSKGFLVDLGRAYGQELTRDVGAAGRIRGMYSNATQATLKPYAAADTFTRGTTYWQGKMQWQDAMAKYSTGKLTWDQLEQKLDFEALSPIDRNIIRQRIVDGNTEGAFDHYIRDIIDETQFPYRKGASARVTYGLTGKLATQFGQWNVEFAHTLSRWIKTGQYDKLIRFYGAAAATKRTIEDTVGFDVNKWVGVNPLNPTFAPFLQFAGDLMSLVKSYRESNDPALEASKDKLIQQVKSLGMPAGVQVNNFRNFMRSVTKSAGNPDIPEGQFGVFTSSGKLLYTLPFKDIWWKMLGFPSAKEQEYRQLQDDMVQDRFFKSQRKGDIMELLQQEKYDAAQQMMEQYQISVGPDDFDAYRIPLLKRTYDSLPKSSKAKFGPKLEHYFSTVYGNQEGGE